MVAVINNSNNNSVRSVIHSARAKDYCYILAADRVRKCSDMLSDLNIEIAAKLETV